MRRAPLTPAFLRSPWVLAPLFGAALIIALIYLLAEWTGRAEGGTGLVALDQLAISAPRTLFWLGAACGLGFPLVRLLLPTSRELLLQALLGVSALLWLDSILGRTGALQAMGGAAAWAILAAGNVILIAQAITAARRPACAAPASSRRAAWWTALLVATALPVAILLTAACSTPGWLWTTEFAGYDVLEYHLELPKEWLALGSVRGLEHNVYSFLPSAVEIAYYHLGVIAGGAGRAAVSAQILHACMALLAALLVARLGMRTLGAGAGLAAGALVLGTPWVIVTGSLAYNEMILVAALAAGLLILEDPDGPARPCRAGLALGAIAGAAILAKPVAAGLVAAPIATAFLLDVRWRRALVPVALGAGIAGFAMILPWLVANALATHNPIFPFATKLLGSGHWNAEQAAIWEAGHRFPGSLAERARAMWTQLFAFGIGPRAQAGEPWLPQWSALPVLSLLGAMSIPCSRVRAAAVRFVAIFAVQVLFWATFTHVRSRFMLPAVVPMALLASTGCATLIERLRPRGAASPGAPTGASGRTFLVLALLAWSLFPLGIFVLERGGNASLAIGSQDVFTGKVHLDLLRAEDGDPESILADAPPALWMNHLLPEDARVISIGEAAVLWFERSNYDYVTTWDRGPLSQIASEGPVETWMPALARRGYTHALIDPVMLEVWDRAGWNDPAITLKAVLDAAKTGATLEHANGGRWLLLRLDAPRPRSP